ncbi:MAG: transcription termination factor Rho, partial [Clostridia bacterium]
YFQSKFDVYVPDSTIKKIKLRRGDFVVGKTVINADSSDYLMYTHSINGLTVDNAFKRPEFDNLIPVYPNEKINLEIEGESDSTMRVLDLMCPIGKGQRALIVSPPKAGKTTIIKKLARAISENHKEIKLFVLLIDERPEEVTDIRTTVNAEVVDSTFDMSYERHVRVTELLLDRAKRLVETGKDVVILLDSITRLARAYNNVITPSGRSLSGGLDTQALQPPKKFFGAARNMNGKGSLTIIATALVDTGSKMDDIIYEEFKGTGNMEIHLDRMLAERRIFPSVNLTKSGTRMDNLLQNSEELDTQYKIRRLLASKNTIDGTIDVLDMLEKTKTNKEFIKKFPEWYRLSTQH